MSPSSSYLVSLSRALPRVCMRTLYRRLESDSWRLDFLLLLLLLRPFGFFLETVGENTGVRSLGSIQGVSQRATFIGRFANEFSESILHFAIILRFIAYIFTSF